MLLAHRAKVDEWRVERLNAWVIRCSLVEKPGSMLDILPLPYDDEEDDVYKGQTDEEIYEQGKVFRMPGVNYG